MVRRDPDRGHHSGLSSPEPLSPRPRGIHPEQLRERSRPTIADRSSAAASITDATSTGSLRSQEIPTAKQKPGPSSTSRPCLRFNSAQPCTRHVRQASPIASVRGTTTQHRPTCPRAPRSQASDTTLVGQLNEKTQDVLKPAAELTACTPREFPAQNTSASKQGRPAAQFFRPSSEMVSASARGRSTQT